MNVPVGLFERSQGLKTANRYVELRGSRARDARVTRRRQGSVRVRQAHDELLERESDLPEADPLRSVPPISDIMSTKAGERLPDHLPDNRPATDAQPSIDSVTGPTCSRM